MEDRMVAVYNAKWCTDLH